MGELLDSCPVANSSPPLLHSFVGIDNSNWGEKLGKNIDNNGLFLSVFIDRWLTNWLKTDRGGNS